MERKNTVAKRRGKFITAGSEREPLTGANPDSSAREILANCGHPIEEIIREVFIPKLHAKKTKFFILGGKIETRVTDDHNIQLKTVVELLKMCGYYAAEKVELNIDQINPIDMRKASDDDLRAILKIAARIEKGNSAGEGRILQAEADDLASGG